MPRSARSSASARLRVYVQALSLISRLTSIPWLRGGGPPLGAGRPPGAREPVAVVGLSCIGVTRGLRALDLLGERCSPFAPGEEPALVQRERHRESLGLPRLADHRAFRVAPYAGTGRRRTLRGCRVDGHVRP